MRFLLLVVVPAIALAAGVELYLRGGRYVSTDNAYMGAQKVLVTPEVSGTVSAIAVAEGQKLKAGDVLFQIDAKPYEIALAAAKADQARVADDFTAASQRYRGLSDQIGIARATVSLRQADVDRTAALVRNKVAAITAADSAQIDLQDARASLAVLEQAQRDTLAQLGGKADQTLQDYAPWLSAKAATDLAQWRFDHTVLRAPLAGTATQVFNIQLGRYLTAGTAVFAIVSGEGHWIDANPKETDMTELKLGQPVTITVDAFPGRKLTGHVAAISPGTGAQFSLIPAQNASGNWVKVVQRVPVRIALDEGSADESLRAGMSVVVTIDTGHQRSLSGLLGWSPAAKSASR
jgi:membrane fusion protein (multidrug efflux system)